MNWKKMLPTKESYLFLAILFLLYAFSGVVFKVPLAERSIMNPFYFIQISIAGVFAVLWVISYIPSLYNLFKKYKAESVVH